MGDSVRATVADVLGSLGSCGRALGDVANGVGELHGDDAPRLDEPVTPEDEMGAALAQAAQGGVFALGGGANPQFFSCGMAFDAETVVSTGRGDHLVTVTAAGQEPLVWALSAPVPVTELLARCEPAPYGDLATQMTVVDPAVRSAVEVRAAVDGGAGFRIDGEMSVEYTRRGAGPPRRCPEVVRRRCDPPLLPAIAKKVADAWGLPGAALRPYKLSVYGPGGFFQPHVDTPVFDASRMVGTVVLLLRSGFSGGDLVVRAPPGAGAGSEADAGFDWCASNWCFMPWAAFFGDCVHEVTPVRSGHRVAVTFAVLASGGVGDAARELVFRAFPWGGVSVDAESRRRDPDRHIARVVELIPAVAPPFGVLLAHKYTHGAAREGGLKGTDARLRAAIEAAGWTTRLQSVAYSAFRVGPHPTSWESGGYGENTVYAFAPEDVAAIRAMRATPYNEREDPPPPGNGKFVRAAALTERDEATADEAAGETLCREYTPADEFTGNEAVRESDETIYFHLALMVEERAVGEGGACGGGGGAGC